MSKESIQSAINKLSREGYLDGHNDSMLKGAIRVLERGVEYEAEKILDAVIFNYKNVGNKKAAQIVADAR